MVARLGNVVGVSFYRSVGLLSGIVVAAHIVRWLVNLSAGRLAARFIDCLVGWLIVFWAGWLVGQLIN